MNHFKYLSYQDTKIRTVEIDGEQWFVLLDICKILGFQVPTTMIASRLEASEHSKLSDGRKLIIVKTSGIYHLFDIHNLLIRKDKPQAKPFKEWLDGIVATTKQSEQKKEMTMDANSNEIINALQLLDYHKVRSIRSITIDGEPWFIGIDIANILGYERPANAIIHHVRKEDIVKKRILDRLGRIQNVLFINVSGAYNLILSSKMPDVNEVKNWFDELLATAKQSERKEEIAMNEKHFDEINDDIEVVSEEDATSAENDKVNPSTNPLLILDYEDKQIRAIEIDGEMWFVAKDVAEVLGYSNTRKAIIDHVDEEDKGVTICDTLGGKQNMAIINESGVYALIFSSKLPNAKNVKKWFGEMLATVNQGERKEKIVMNEKHFDEIENEKIEDYSEKADVSTNALQIWNYEDSNVRTLEIDGELWFVAKDVAEVLGYSNTRKAIIDHVDEEDKNTVTIRDGNKGNPNQTIINESGVYALIFGSKLPNAKKFKRWVTSVVLPSIHKHGAYIQGQEYLSKKDLEDVYQKMTDFIAQNQKQNNAVSEKIARMQQKVRLEEIKLEKQKADIQAELQKQQLEFELKKREMELQTEQMEINRKMISSLSAMYCMTNEQRESLISLAVRIATGTEASELIPSTSVITSEPIESQKLYSATEIGAMLNITAHKVGSISNKKHLKSAKYGSYFKTKDANGIDRQVFKYNELAVEKIREFLQNEESQEQQLDSPWTKA